MRLGREPGFTVRQAGSLAEALEMLQGVDIAVLDLRLRDGNGADLIERIHAVNPDAKALVHTSSTDPADLRQAFDRGAAAVLDKRAGLDELVAMVKGLQ
jgi:DNA-binding NarL/FixJ family response regulator